jgi:signal transduction histidine kinase
MNLPQSFVKKRSGIILQLVSIIVLGGFLSFLFLAKTDSTVDALLIGYFYATTLIFILAIVQKTVINKIDVFSSVQQWTLRSFIYTISISTTYLAGLLFQSAILKPNVKLTEFIGDKLWASFVSFISSPLDLEIANSLFKEEYRIALIPFFAVIILIGLVSLIGSYVEMRWQQNRQQLAVDKAELTALKAQIEPHFLFNSLNTITSEIKNNADNAEQLILKLSDILRYLFDNSSQEMIRIEEEISFLKKYADLIQARFGNKVQIKWHNSLKNGNKEVPVLLLQPLVENSIRHGRSEKIDVLRITIDINENNLGILVTVKDNGQGIESNRLKKLPTKGHALANINERLQLSYKKSDLLKIESKDGQGTTVSILLPVRTK